MTCPLCGQPADLAYVGRDLLHGVPGAFAYRSCPRCACVFQDPAPDEARLRTFYPDDYVAYRPERPKPPRALERAVLRARYGYAHLEAPRWARLLAPLARGAYGRALSYVEGGRLLDVGCGSGKFLAAQRALGWTVTGIDADERAVAACRAAGLDVRAGSIETADLEDAQFHCVTARHVLEHVTRPDAFVAGLARVLRPGGRLHVRTPNAAALGRKRYGGCWFADDVPRHVVLYSPSNLDALLVRHGLARTSLKTRSTPKVLLNSRDLASGRRGRPSRYRRLARLGARPAVWTSQLLGRGYEIVANYRRI